MGGSKKFAEEAEFREPPQGWAVIEGGKGRNRRPDHSVASSEQEAPHEAPPQHSKADLAVPPAHGAPADPESQEAKAAPRLTLLPSAGDSETQGNRSEERRAADAGGAARKPHRATRIDSIALIIEEIPAESHEQPAAREAIRLMAQWLCRRYDSRQCNQRKAA